MAASYWTNSFLAKFQKITQHNSQRLSYQCSRRLGLGYIPKLDVTLCQFPWQKLLEKILTMTTFIPTQEDREFVSSRESHVIGFADLVDLWVTKIKAYDPLRAVRRDHVNKARNTDHAARTCERFVNSIVKITRVYDYQRRQTHLFLKFTTFLIVLFGCCLVG